MTSTARSRYAEPQTANAVVSITKLATALAVCGLYSPWRIATASVADCHVSPDFAQNFYDVSFAIACDIKPAGNKWWAPFGR